MSEVTRPSGEHLLTWRVNPVISPSWLSSFVIPTIWRASSALSFVCEPYSHRSCPGISPREISLSVVLVPVRSVRFLRPFVGKMSVIWIVVLGTAGLPLRGTFGYSQISRQINHLATLVIGLARLLHTSDKSNLLYCDHNICSLFTLLWLTGRIHHASSPITNLT